MRLLFTLCLAGVLLTPVVVRAQRERLSPDEYDYVAKTWPNAKQTNTGIRYIIEKEGVGQPPNPGDKVSVLYVGRLLLTGKVFDTDLDRQHPLTFRVDRGAVIRGWDQILQEMKLGEKRLVIIPSDYAYGSRGQGPDIPADTALVFEMELIKIERVE
jgi:FKBP-type peptidyl-prolyl cis-trans isomerase